MAERLDRHANKENHKLFDEDTAEVGSLGDVIEAHSGDSVRLGPPDRSVGGADGGESDSEAEANPEDPSAEWEELDDEFPGEAVEDEQGVGETDITGTAAGIARGFGSHLPQDLGSGGFQIEEIPSRAIGKLRPLRAGEELDDYDDDDPTNGKFDPRELESLSIPGSSPAEARADDGRRHVRGPVTFDEGLDHGVRDR